MKSALNKYEFLLTSGKWNVIYPEQVQIVALTTVEGKIKDNKIKLSKSVTTYLKI